MFFFLLRIPFGVLFFLCAGHGLMLMGLTVMSISHVLYVAKLDIFFRPVGAFGKEGVGWGLFSGGLRHPAIFFRPLGPFWEEALERLSDG